MQLYGKLLMILRLDLFRTVLVFSLMLVLITAGVATANDDTFCNRDTTPAIGFSACGVQAQGVTSETLEKRLFPGAFPRTLSVSFPGTLQKCFRRHRVRVLQPLLLDQAGSSGPCLNLYPDNVYQLVILQSGISMMCAKNDVAVI